MIEATVQKMSVSLADADWVLQVNDKLMITQEGCCVRNSITCV